MSDGIGSPAMAIDLAALLQDPEDLRQYCAQLLAELDAKTQLIEKLSHELVRFRATHTARSEKLDPGRILLEFTDWQKDRNPPRRAPEWERPERAQSANCPPSCRASA